MRNKRCKNYISCIALVIMLLVAIFMTVINITNKQDKHVETSYKPYTVQAGDNLTKIANKYYADVYLPEAIFEIKKENNLEDSSLKIGQVLKIREE